jgi:phosphopantothenoylcysteine decarboxylase/phosphopantothenate--cysteine ligase
VEYATGNKPILEIDGGVQHVALCGEHSDKVDGMLVFPATANTISKMAMGIDDTAVTTFATTAIGSGIPMIIVPAMHGTMYRHSIVMENIEKLKDLEGADGRKAVHFIDPRMDEKAAKAASIQMVVSGVIRVLGKADMQRKKALVITGASYEEIDDFRVVTNRSSGRTGAELALACYERGADTEVWAGTMQTVVPDYIPVKRFTTTSSLEELLDSGSLNYDYIFMPAALSDFSPEKKDGKIPSSNEMTLKMQPTTKIVEAVREKFKGTLVMFKAEVGLVEEKLFAVAQEKLAHYGADFVVANDVQKVKVEDTEIHVIDKKGSTATFKGSKAEAADFILDTVLGA